MKKLFIVLTAFLLLCSACSKTTSGYHEENKQDYTFPASYMITTENKFDYQPGYECAAFSSAYVLRHYGEEADGLMLFKTFPNKVSTGDGVFPKGIENFFKDRNYKAVYVENASIDEVKHEVSKGSPVIVHIHVEVPKENIHATHYVPIVGYDEQNFYLAESLEQYANAKEDTSLPYNRKISIEDFKKLWNNIDGVFEQPYFRIEKIK